MSSDNGLVVIEQKEVVFYNDMITAVLVADGNVYVPIRPICKLLGVAWDPQRRRITRDPVLSEAAKGVTVTVAPSSRDGRGGGPQEMTCLPLDYLNGWLFGITASRVKEEIRSRLIQYQKECYRILFQAFQEGQLTTDSSFNELLQNAESPSVQAYHIAQAMVKMARQQILIESRLDQHDSALASNMQRIENLETRLGDPRRLILPEQATRIAQAVKLVALELGKQSGRNEFQGVWGELYRRFQVPSYRELPAAKFEEAMLFLRDWYSSLTDESEIPF